MDYPHNEVVIHSNKIPELRKMLEPEAIAAQSEPARQRAAQEMFYRILAEARRLQPVHRHDDPTPGRDPRPSRRRGFKPIEEGWIENNFGPGGFGLASESEHINWQRLGIEGGYPIPSSPTGVRFWWGDPLPWSPRLMSKTVENWYEGKYEITTDKIVRRAPGVFVFAQIGGENVWGYTSHPGIKPWGGSDFVARADDATAEENMATFVRELSTIWGGFARL